MARNDGKMPQSSSGKVKFRIIEFEMEGGNDRIEQGLRAFAQSVARSDTAPRITSNIRGSAPGILEASQPQHVENATESQPNPEVAESEEASEIPSPQRPRRRPAPRAPKFLNTVDLTAADVQLAAYVAMKDPKDTQEKYIVISQWFKEFLGVEEFSVDHIYTAYKHLGWQAQLPPDPGQPLRDLRYKKSWLDQGSGKATYKLNWSGTNYVNKLGSSS